MSGIPVHDDDLAGKVNARFSSIYSAIVIRDTPKGDESIFANPVALKDYTLDVMRSGSRGIYDIGITEIRFDDQFEPIKFRIKA